MHSRTQGPASWAGTSSVPRRGPGVPGRGSPSCQASRAAPPRLGRPLSPLSSSLPLSTHRPSTPESRDKGHATSTPHWPVSLIISLLSSKIARGSRPGVPSWPVPSWPVLSWPGNARGMDLSPPAPYPGGCPRCGPGAVRPAWATPTLGACLRPPPAESHAPLRPRSQALPRSRGPLFACLPWEALSPS